MMYFLLGLSITLAFLLIVNMTVAMAASLFWKVIKIPARRLSVHARATLIFGLRVIPVVLALVFVKAFVLPAYFIHEPQNSGEVVSAKLALIALLCVAGVVIATVRVFQTWRATHRLMKNWLSHSSQVKVEGVGLPIHCIKHAFPVLAVIGIFRPRIFVAETVLETLEDGELRAAIAHEYGHLRARDNLKRTVLRICRDLVILPIGKDLDLAWAQSAEVVADEFAADRGASTALDLASALVKITRIVPSGVAPTLPVGAYIITDRQGDIANRINRLMRAVDDRAGIRRDRRRWVSSPGFILTATSVALLAFHLSDQRLLLTTHEAIERFVKIVQ